MEQVQTRERENAVWLSPDQDGAMPFALADDAFNGVNAVGRDR
jgi:hypothetical protein